MQEGWDVYQNIERERMRYGYSIEELSQLLGICPAIYRAWEQRGEIPAEQLRKLSQLFGCSVNYLLGLEEELQ